MKTYFVTHGTSKDNEECIASGWKDVELSELGLKQAKERGEVFKDIELELVCCSDLRRSVNTVQIAFGHKYPMIIDKRLREVNYGDFNGKPVEIVNSMKKDRIEKPFANGESYIQAITRIHDFCTELKANHAEKVILIVGHSTTKFGLDILTGKRTIEECLSIPFKWQPYWEYCI